VRSSGHSGTTRRPLIISQALELCGLLLRLGLLLAMALRTAAPRSKVFHSIASPYLDEFVVTFINNLILVAIMLLTPFLNIYGF